MQVDPDAELLLRNLTIVAMAKQNDKLYTLGSTFEIDPPTARRSVMRRWYGEGRLHNIERISDTVQRSMQLVAMTLTETAVPDEVRHDQRMRRQVRFLNALESAQRGVRNLIVTYQTDSTAQVRLSLLDQQIQDFVDATRERVHKQASPQQRASSSPLDAIHELALAPAALSLAGGDGPSAPSSDAGDDASR